MRLLDACCRSVSCCRLAMSRWFDLSFFWEALQRSELRVSSLNFSGNGLGPAGASQIGDFVQAAGLGGGRGGVGGV